MLPQGRKSHVIDQACLSASGVIWERRTRVVDHKGHDSAVGEREVLQFAAARGVQRQRRRRRQRLWRACRRRRHDVNAFAHLDIERVQAARCDVEGVDTLHGTGAQDACSHLAHVTHCQQGGGYIVAKEKAARGGRQLVAHCQTVRRVRAVVPRALLSTMAASLSNVACTLGSKDSGHGRRARRLVVPHSSAAAATHRL